VLYAKRKYDPPYFLLINNDTFVHPDFLTNLVSAAEASDSLGICSPKIYCWPERDKIWWQGPHKVTIGWRHRDNTKETVRDGTEIVTGCCMLIKSKVVEQVGLLDPRFFLTGLDSMDYALRAKAKGFESSTVHSAIMWHKSGQAALKRNWFRQQKDSFKPMVIFYSRHGKSYKFPSLVFFYILGFVRMVLEESIVILTSKEKREKFENWVRQ
jgi:GT2 family glycosyltransferase